MEIAIDRMNWEHLIAQPMRGIVWTSGLDTPDQFAQQLKSFNEDRQQSDLRYYPGVFFGGSVSKDSNIRVIPWTEPPVGYTPATWDQRLISEIAASFAMNETHLRLKLGEGAMTQSGVADSLEAETAVSWMRHTIDTMMNHIAPPRVSVTVVWNSDRTKRVQIDIAEKLSITLRNLTQANMGEPVYTTDQIRALMTEFVGIEAPQMSAGDKVTTAKNADDIAEGLHGAGMFKGKRVAINEIIRFGEDRMLAWVDTGSRRMLVSADDIFVRKDVLA